VSRPAGPMGRRKSIPKADWVATRMLTLGNGARRRKPQRRARTAGRLDSQGIPSRRAVEFGAAVVRKEHDAGE